MTPDTCTESLILLYQIHIRHNGGHSHRSILRGGLLGIVTGPDRMLTVAAALKAEARRGKAIRKDNAHRLKLEVAPGPQHHPLKL
jgi:hypothetical protein